MKRRSSSRAMRAPIPSWAIPSWAIPSRTMSSSFALFGGVRHGGLARGCRNRLDDVVIAGAATQIAVEIRADRRLVGMGNPVEQIDRHHDHSGRAEPTLKSVVLAKCRLHRVEIVAFGQALDGGDLATRGLRRQHRAGFDRATVEVNDAGTALTGIAADMGPCQSQRVAQEFDQKGPVLDLSRYRSSVHL